MKNNIASKLALLFIFILTTLSFTQQKIQIKVTTDNMPDKSTVHIVGNTEELGYWNFMRKMEKLSEKEWLYTANASSGETLQFKFTRGSDWSTEAVDSNGIEFPNFNHRVQNDT